MKAFAQYTLYRKADRRAGAPDGYPDLNAGVFSEEELYETKTAVEWKDPSFDAD